MRKQLVIFGLLLVLSGGLLTARAYLSQSAQDQNTQRNASPPAVSGAAGPEAERHIIARGLPASPGAASGRIVFSADRAEAEAAAGREVILCRIETSPEDIHGMHAARGILTTRGGMTSHAAVVARGMGRPCVSGASELRIDTSAS